MVATPLKKLKAASIARCNAIRVHIVYVLYKRGCGKTFLGAMDMPPIVRQIRVSNIMKSWDFP